MVLAAITVVAGLQRSFGRWGWDELRMCHRVMARHRRRLCARGGQRAQAVHGSSLGHGQRPEGRDEHDQQETPCSPAMRSPHLRKSIAEKQFSVVRNIVAGN
ncbi:MAG: hypothetical protein ABSG02_04780 [Terriglobales bacterium]